MPNIFLVIATGRFRETVPGLDHELPAGAETFEL